MSEVFIRVCPICGELAHDSDDYGPNIFCHHPPYESIEPVEITGRVEDGDLRFTLPDPEEWKATVGVEIIAKQNERDVKRAAWLALTCDERQAKNAERREKMSEMGRFIHDMMCDDLVDQARLMNQMTWGDSYTTTDPCPKCKDVGCPNAPKRVVQAASLEGPPNPPVK